MALQTLPRPISYPGVNGVNNSTGNFTAGSTLDAAGEYYAYVGIATEDMSVTHVGVRTHTATGSPTVEIRIEAIHATTGLLNGLIGTTTNVTTGTLTASDFSVHALTSTATIAKGTPYAVVFKYATGTTWALSRYPAALTAQSVFPYVIANTGTPTKTDMGIYSFCIALGSSSTSFYKIPRTIPITNTAVSSSASTSTYDATGVRFKVPFKCRCVGFIHPNSGVAGRFDYGIYTGTNAASETEVSSSLTTWFDTDILVGTGTFNTSTLYFDNAVTLSADTWYRLALWPTTSTSCGFIGFEYDDANLQAVGPGGNNWHFTRKALGGSWDDSNTLVSPFLSLVIDQLDDGVSAGGGGFSVFVG